MVLKESQGKEFFWAVPWLQAGLGSWAKQQILVQSYCYFKKWDFFFAVKQDYFKEIPGSCNQFLILMETACDIVHTGQLLRPWWS